MSLRGDVLARALDAAPTDHATWSEADRVLRHIARRTCRRYGEEFEARPLTLGRSDGRFVEVLKGLRAGEAYAAKNSFLIKAELGKSEASHDH